VRLIEYDIPTHLNLGVLRCLSRGVGRHLSSGRTSRQGDAREGGRESVTGLSVSARGRRHTTHKEFAAQRVRLSYYDPRTANS
jgi:hypothetical protein